MTLFYFELGSDVTLSHGVFTVRSLNVNVVEIIVIDTRLLWPPLTSHLSGTKLDSPLDHYQAVFLGRRLNASAYFALDQSS